MPFGAFKLNTISAVLASGGGSSDAPTIPSLSFDALTANNTGYTVGNYVPANGIAYVGVNNSRTHWGYTAFSASTVYNTCLHTNWSNGINSSYSTGGTGNSGMNSIASAGPGINGTTGGTFISIIGNSTGIRYRSSLVTGWSTGTSTGALSAGTISTSQARTSSYTTPSVSIAHSKYITTPGTNRVLMAYHTALSTTNYIAIATATQNSGSTTVTLGITLVSGTQIASSTTASFGNHIDVCGFSTNSTTETRYAVGYTGSTSSYIVRATKIYNNAAYTTAVTPYSGSSILQASVDTIWDDYTNSKSVAVSCVSISGNTFLRSIKITNWFGGTTTVPTVSMGTELALGFNLANVKISKVNDSGLGLLVYTNASGYRIYARFISVDSSTGDITLGSEIALDAADGTVQMGYFGVGVGLDDTNKVCIGTQGVGPTGVSWRHSMYRSTSALA